MTAEYSPFAKPTFSAADFERSDAELGDESPMFAAAPIYAQPKSRKAKGGINPLVYVAVPAVALALGAGVMFMGAPKDEAAPPPSAANTVAPAPMLAPAQTAANDAPPTMAPEAPVATPARIETPRATARVAATPTRVARARPAPAAVSAEGVGTNASATLPATPQAYSGSAQTSASAPMTIVIPPVTAAPATVTPDSAQPEAAATPTP
ncbi:hypothetical protein JKL49_16415 [Phenylobacterium sp. 20VBR1]|uniref:Uncharacterized protein n=1 Tax=Phenylobacterium glaciei TaxID=2803784 RepID=A0A941D3L6_9CAUL|nr:hypothetical protein [Phenylobacterium glaciei]MBR7620979.1 hypothetical protein [Phenylobacterium glaciei]